MKLHCINDLSDQYLNKLLEDAFSKINNPKLEINYHPKHRDNPANIFYILSDANGRYKKGNYYILENNEKYVCSAGWNEYELDTSIALALTRAYVDPLFRGKYYMAKFILPNIIKETRNYENLYITSDNFNSVIYQYFLRASQGKRTALFNPWPDIYKNFVPIGKKNIYYTEQYVMAYKHE